MPTLPGPPLERVVKDDTANPDVGLLRSQAFSQEGVVATLGFWQHRHADHRQIPGP